MAIDKQSDCKTVSRSTSSRFTTMSNGFTAVELLITLFIAAAFLMSGYQLYSIIIKDGGQTRAQARASNVAYDYLQRYKSNMTNPCVAQTPLTDSSVVVAGLSDVTVSVVVTCPYASATSISKILVTVKYNTPQQTVSSATYVPPQDIVTDGLVLNLDAGNVKSIKGRKSIINWDSWTVGAGGTTGYNVNGDGNSRVMDTNPWGASDVVWDVSNQDVASDADGGWNTSTFSIDNTKMYRFTTWVRRKTIGAGTFYFGTSGGGASVLNRSDGAVNGNPYFYARDWWGPANQWYLVVGYVWPAGSGTGAVMPESGVYALDGTKVSSTLDYVWQPTTTSSYHRSYLYYSTDITTNQQWYQPRVDVIDGTEPTVTELLNNAGNTWYDLSGNNKNGTLLNGVGYTSANSGSLSFDGVNDVINLGTGNTFFPLPNFSMELWFKSNGTTPTTGIYPALLGITYGIDLYVYPSYLQFGLDNGTTSDYLYSIGTYSFHNSSWHQVVIQANSTTMYIYIDGLLSNTLGTIWSGTTRWPTNGALFGRSTNDGNRFFTGNIASTRFYNRVLLASEIQQNFHAIRGRYGI